MAKYVYENNTVEWYVAASPEHAASLAEEEANRNGFELNEEDLAFKQCPDDQIIEIKKYDLSKSGTRKTCREWASCSEIGFLATTEY